MTALEYCTTHAVNPNTARDRLKKQGFAWSNNAELTPEMQDIISRVKRNGVVPAKPRKINGHAEIEVREKKPREAAQVHAKKNGFFLSALCVTMGVQMGHTAAFFYLNCPIENGVVRIAWAVLFAYGVDCTALVMTIKGAGKWILYLFLTVHFVMNLTYHLQAHDSTTWPKIWGYVLLSGVIAFSNFSYTDLFQKK